MLSALAAAIALGLAAPSAFAGAQLNLSGLESEPTHDQFIVQYRKGSAAHGNAAALGRSIEAAARGIAASGGRALAVRHLRRLAVGADVVKAARALNRAEAEALMRTLAADPDVEYVELDQRMYPVATPNDTRYNDQWHYFDATASIKANEAWDSSTGSGIVVAVIDTGITPHSDLNGNIVAGYDFVSDSTAARDGNGRDSNPNDEGDWYSAGECGRQQAGNSSWHGTHVAGTVAAVTNNSKGVAGVAYGAKVSPVRVLAKCGGTTSDIADAIVWASGGSVSGVPANANPAEIINLSLGGSGSCSSTSQAAIYGAVQRGTTVVIAAGNSGQDVSGFNPANCNNVIAVAAIDRQGKRSIWSSSQSSNYGNGIDVAAPGSEILSTHNAGTQGQGAETYSSWGGTSMACPHVAGVAALMQAAAASSPKTPAQIETLLKDTLRAFPQTPDRTIGAGMVDANAAVAAVNGNPPPPPSGDTLSNGTPVTGISGATGSNKTWTLAVPAGATNLKFVTSGGSGDADLYVKFGSAPTTTSNDCKSEGSTNAETCNISTAQAGTYHVLVYGYAAYSGMSLTGSYTTGGGGGVQTYTNDTNVGISDNATVESPVTVSGRSGNAPSNAAVTVNIVHTYIGDLKVDVVAPDGSVYTLHNRSGGSADNINKSYTVNLSSEALNGTWKLRVNDNWVNDTGYIDSWSVRF